MYGPLVAVVLLLLAVAAIVLWLSDVSEARSRKAIDRIHAEGRRSKHW